VLSAVLHHSLLAQVYQLPEPCSAEFLAAVTQWQFTPEAEDEEQKRREFYGMGGGTTFGEVSHVQLVSKGLLWKCASVVRWSCGVAAFIV
jgi:hypothetical protein